MLISLNNLDFDINSFKGIDIYNKFDSGKYVANRNLYGMNIDSKNDKKDFNLDLPIYNSRFGIKNEDRKTNTEMKLNKIEKNKINKKETIVQKEKDLNNRLKAIINLFLSFKYDNDFFNFYLIFIFE